MINKKAKYNHIAVKSVQINIKSIKIINYTIQ